MSVDLSFGHMDVVRTMCLGLSTHSKALLPRLQIFKDCGWGCEIDKKHPGVFSHS
jgi:hypothetical protein